MKKQQEKTIEININLTQSLILLLFVTALLATVFVSNLAFGQREVGAASPETSQAVSTSKRQFYLTKHTFWGGEALTACAPGYHMASLWEILDPSNLQYNTALGFTADDGGQGPVTIVIGGWVRTGFSNDTSNTPGRGNCNGWTSSDSSDYGTFAYLPSDWTTGSDIEVWKTETAQCDASWYEVWCVED